jgi:hypothetical protein
VAPNSLTGASRNILWTHGTADIVVADGSAWEMGTLGKMGVVPGWPGEEVFPPQAMVTQIRNVLTAYKDAGGQVQMEMFEGSGHGPLFDATERWSGTFFKFLVSAEKEVRAGIAGSKE